MLCLLLTINIKKVTPAKIILVKNKPVYSAEETHESIPNRGKSPASIYK
jgi:hypothetical protein